MSLSLVALKHLSFHWIQVGGHVPTWIQWKDKFFKATKAKLTWSQAHDECSKMGGVMATPNSTEDTQQLLSITQDEHFWIDCNDLVVVEQSE